MGIFDALFNAGSAVTGYQNPSAGYQQPTPSSSFLQAQAAYNSGQVVRGASVNPNTNYIGNLPYSGGSGGGTGTALNTTQQGSQPSQPSAEEQARNNYESQVRGDINSGYDSYISELDNILNSSLPGQQTSQQGIVESQYNQGLNTLGAQKTEGLFDLNTQRQKTESQQSKTLRDVSSNISNLFQTGNVYLGARGGGDSSAANQYSYALTKLGTQARSDVQRQGADIFSEINGREFKLKNMYDSEVRNLQETKNQKILSIENWFHEQQNALKQAKAQGQLSRSQDIANLSKSLLDQAIAAINFTKQEASNRQSALESWAMSNSSNINQLKSNLSSVSNYSSPNLQAKQIAGNPSYDSRGNLYTPAVGYGYGNNEEKKSIFA